MAPAEIKQLINAELAANNDWSNSHGIDVRVSLIEPVKQIYVNTLVHSKSDLFWTVLEETPDKEGYKIFFDEEAKMFGLGMSYDEEKLMNIGHHGSFRNALKAMPAAKAKSKNTPPNDFENEYREIIARLSKFIYPTYLPIVVSAEKQFSAKSKFGGFPYLRHENDWETCPQCKKRMQLLVQINLWEALDVEERVNSIVQLFYCQDDCESIARSLEIKGESKKVACNPEESFDEKQITGWDLKNDYPHHDEHLSLDQEIDIPNEVDWLMQERKEGLCLRNDKLFGWPYWEQETRYPIDESTGEEMHLLFQIVSNQNLPISFGDDGILQIFFNNLNELKLATAWNCG